MVASCELRRTTKARPPSCHESACVHPAPARASRAGATDLGRAEYLEFDGLPSRFLQAADHAALTTASLQSTRVGEGVYRSIGFRPLHRILEYTPHRSAGRHQRGAA